jgi:hypothetical protein
MIGKTARLFLLAGLLLGASSPTAGEIDIHIKIGGGGSSKLAKNLAKDVDGVRRKFDDSRVALPIVKGPGGVPAYPRKTVLDLIDATEKELDQAVLRVDPRKLAGLENWANLEIERSRHALEKRAGTVAALSPASDRAAAVFASGTGGKGRGPRTKPRKAPPKAAPPPAPEPPKPDPLEATTVATAQASPILDQVGRVIGRLFFLADKDDLEVDLWVGSTPKQHTKFSFWAQGAGKRSPLEPIIIQTNGRRKHVLRGLYEYRAAASLDSKSVTEILESGPGPAGGVPSERLDLVNGSRFFCCRFDDNYCHHVDDPKECQTERR